VLNQDSILHAHNIRHNPVHRQPDARVSAVDNDEVSLCYEYTWLILKRRRRAPDQVEQAVTARLNVRTVLDMGDNRCTLSARTHKL
jgi:hypothetical protein